MAFGQKDESSASAAQAAVTQAPKEDMSWIDEDEETGGESKDGWKSRKVGRTGDSTKEEEIDNLNLMKCTLMCMQGMRLMMSAVFWTVLLPLEVLQASNPGSSKERRRHRPTFGPQEESARPELDGEPRRAEQPKTSLV